MTDVINMTNFSSSNNIAEMVISVGQLNSNFFPLSAAVLWIIIFTLLSRRAGGAIAGGDVAENIMAASSVSAIYSFFLMTLTNTTLNVLVFTGFVILAAASAAAVKMRKP